MAYNNMAGVAYNITRIVNQMIKRARRDLETREQKIIDQLVRMENSPIEDRLIYISSLVAEEDRLTGTVVELVGSIGECVEKHVPPLNTVQSPPLSQPDEIPMKSIYLQMKSLSNHILLSGSQTGVLEGLLNKRQFDDPEIEFNSKTLIINACELEKGSVTEKKWEPLSKSDPGGMMGCTYNQLQIYYPEIAPKFRDKFQSEADKYLGRADEILEKIKKPSPNSDKCLQEASELLFDASGLVKRASRWIPLKCG